jgi:mRNA-degrading endonuclease RelE of RelBE toxin-antitoxin system
MRHEIVLAPEAAEDFKALKASDRATIRDAMEDHLRYEPTKTSKSRIKRLRGLRRPQYRLRVGDIRVFYDVSEKVVGVLAIVSKTGAAAWLARHGTARRRTRRPTNTENASDERSGLVRDEG